MRWLLAAALILIATPAFAQENEAEKLFREMEKKINEAKSLKVVWEGDTAVAGMKVKIGGVLYLAEGNNKARIEAIDPFKKQLPIGAFLVSDGKQMVLRNGVETRPTDTKFLAMVATCFHRGGYFNGLMPFVWSDQEKEAFEVAKAFPASDFKLGPKERLLDRESQVVEYESKSPWNQRINVRVWIDTKTMTPLKKGFTSETPSGTSSETYTEFLINPQLDPKLFELPK